MTGVVDLRFDEFEKSMPREEFSVIARRLSESIEAQARGLTSGSTQAELVHLTGQLRALFNVAGARDPVLETALVRCEAMLGQGGEPGMEAAAELAAAFICFSRALKERVALA